MRKKYLLSAVLGLSLFLPLFANGQSDSGDNSSNKTATSNMGGALAAMDSSLAADELTSIDEYYLGRAVAANILSTYKLYHQNPELTRYLNRICQTIAINSPQPELYNGYHVSILDSPEFNAFATPGGHILITRGLIGITQNEDMLAAVIAHEFAHIFLKHGAAIISDMRLNDELDAAAQQAGKLAARESSTAARAVLLRNSVSALADVMIKNGYARPQEFEADAAAIMLLAASGYNPGALMEVLRILERVQGSQKGGFNTTHPSPAERIHNANTMTGRYNVQDTTSSRTARFRNR